jgi:alanyl-tRNA synthetase
VIRGEEADFQKTIKRGLTLFEEAEKEARAHGNQISGAAVFDLHTTHGFPPDLTRQMAQERGLTIDEEDYRRRWGIHTEGGGKETTAQVALNVSGALPETDDRQWYGPQVERRSRRIADNTYHTSGTLRPNVEAGLLLDKTCFYAEAGGQVGDRGTITGRRHVPGNLDRQAGQRRRPRRRSPPGTIQAGQTAKLVVDPGAVHAQNHTATHLLHWALQRCSASVTQRGSKVKPDEFTFDFDHNAPLTDAEKAEVERLVNEKIYQDLPVQWRELAIKEAQRLPGVRAFFGDKYGDVVRVVEVGDGFSREFCGGTHLEHTGQAGFFKIVGEEAGQGVRG